MITNIGIIGMGYVGLTTAIGFLDGNHKVWCYDSNPDKLVSLSSGKCPICEPGMDEILKEHSFKDLHFTSKLNWLIGWVDIIFVCVGTPSNDDGSTNLEYIYQVAQSFNDYNRCGNEYKIVVIKSTVPPGTTREFEHRMNPPDVQSKFHVVHNPEFLREGKAISDVKNPDRIIFGLGEPNKDLCRELSCLYKWHSRIKFVKYETSELIKYASNTFLANKISFINLMSQLCDAIGADIDDVAEGMGLDKRIGKDFLKAGIGFGGSCFPKDISSLIHTLEDNQISSKLPREILNINNNQVDCVVNGIKSLIVGVGANLRGKTIAIYGLSFKPDTDDIREAPSIKLIQQLLEYGAMIKAHDPAINKEDFLDICPSITINQNDNIYSIAESADIAVLVTEWESYKTLSPDKLLSVMKKPVFYDSRNVLDRASFEKAGFRFVNIGKWGNKDATQCPCDFRKQ